MNTKQPDASNAGIAPSDADRASGAYLVWILGTANLGFYEEFVELARTLRGIAFRPGPANTGSDPSSSRARNDDVTRNS